MSSSLLQLGLHEIGHPACRLIKIQDHPLFIGSAVKRLREETAALCSSSISSDTAAKLAEFIVWHIFLEGICLFEEKHAHNTQNYDWLSTTSTPGIDMCGVANINGEWAFVVTEIKWSEVCAYTQITSTSQGLVHDLKKLFLGKPSNRLASMLSSLRRNLRKHPDSRYAYDGLKNVIAGYDPCTTTGVYFYGVFVADMDMDKSRTGFIHPFKKLSETAGKLGWKDGNVQSYFITGTPLYDILDAIAQGKE